MLFGAIEVQNVIKTRDKRTCSATNTNCSGQSEFEWVCVREYYLTYTLHNVAEMETICNIRCNI